MRTSNTFSILFWVNPSRAKNYLTTVQARITVNGKRATIRGQTIFLGTNYKSSNFELI